MKSRVSYWLNDNSRLLIALSVTQLSQFAVMLLQINYYGLSEYGKLSLLVGLSGILSLVLRGGIVTSISILIAHSSRKLGQPIFALAACLAVISSIIISLITYLLGHPLGAILGFSLTHDSDVVLLLTGYFILYEYAESLLKGAGKITYLAVLIISISVIVFVLSVLLIYMEAEWHMHFLVRSVTQGSLSLIVILSLIRRIDINYSLISELTKSLKNVGIVVWLSSLTGEIAGRLNEFALAFFFTSEISATYKFLLALVAPTKLITASISKSSFHKYSRQQKIPVAHRKTNNIVSLVILLFTIPVAIFASIYLSIPMNTLLLPAFLATLTASISSYWAFKLTFLEVHKFGVDILKACVLMALVHIIAIWLLTSNYTLIGALSADVLANLTFMLFISYRYRINIK